MNEAAGSPGCALAGAGFSSTAVPASRDLPTVLATGAFLKNTAGLLHAGSFLASPIHGDLGTADACRHLDASIEALTQQLPASARIDAVAHDLHPDFASTRLAQAWADRLGVPAIGVQHHAAHLAVVAAEQGLTEPFLGWALDGYGIGDDGAAWGGELLRLEGASWERLAHLQPIALPGGDRAAREPWRMAAAALHALGRGETIAERFAASAGPSANHLAAMLDRGVHCPPTTSAGRWFDAAAAALGLCLRQHDEAQAAIALEAAAARAADRGHGRPLPVELPLVPQVSERSEAPIRARASLPSLNLLHLIDSLSAVDASDPTAVDAAALAFHDALADGLIDIAAREARTQHVHTIALAGGCFFNRLLSERVTAGLQQRGLRVLRPIRSCGDAGLALGQAWLAAQSLPAVHAATTSSSRSLESAPCA